MKCHVVLPLLPCSLSSQSRGRRAGGSSVVLGLIHCIMCQAGQGPAHLAAVARCTGVSRAGQFSVWLDGHCNGGHCMDVWIS